MTEAQEIVKNVDSSEIGSVQKSLGGVEAAQLACEKTGLSREFEELTKAKNQLRGHLDYLQRKANEPSQQKRTPEEIEQLVKTGDPSCPKGQAYKPRGSEKEIRCTGEQPINMSRAEAEKYFTRRGYKMAKEGEDTLTAEYGAELFIYKFDAKGRPAKCLVLHPPPGMSWQEAVARVSGVQPRLLEIDGEVATERGKASLHVVEKDSKVVVQIGEC
jgi:hypothetical protein